MYKKSLIPRVQSALYWSSSRPLYFSKSITSRAPIVTGSLQYQRQRSNTAVLHQQRRFLHTEKNNMGSTIKLSSGYESKQPSLPCLSERNG